MALFLQFQLCHLQTKKDGHKFMQKQQKFQSSHLFKRFIEDISDKENIVTYKEIIQGNNHIILSQIGLLKGVSLLCYFSISHQLQLRMSLNHQDKYWCLGSKAHFNNIGKIANKINKSIFLSGIVVLISPQSRQLKVKIYPNTIKSSLEYALSHFLAALISSAIILRSIIPIFLHTCNIISQTQLKKSVKNSQKKLFFGIHSGFSRYSELYELLPLMNSEYRNLMDPMKQDIDCQNFSRIISLYYTQLQKNIFIEKKLYTQNILTPQESLINLAQEIKQLSYPTYDNQKDLTYLFNTIYILDRAKNQEMTMFQGGKGRIIASPSKFIYEQSIKIYQDDKDKPKVNQYDDIERINQFSKLAKLKGQFNKVLLIKMPLENIPGRHRIFMSIRYEKQILTHFRTSKCKYLPRYYHSVQQTYEYKDCLLMDYIPGLTLAQQLRLKSASISLKSKLIVLSHISNAIRFIEQYQIAHLDLTPNNIIVQPNLFIKIIDFGQAYHPLTSHKYSYDSNQPNNRFVYAPGRTFPYAPPETSFRILKFTNQQDMFSLGVILCQVIFQCFPLFSSEDFLKMVYRSKKFSDRIFLAPQRVQDYGQVNLMLVLINLMTKLLDPNQNRRPLPLWTYLILKKLAFFVI